MNHASLTGLYERLRPQVFRQALRLLRDTEEAWDVTQDTFLAFWRAQPLLRGEASPWTVLYGIVTRRAIDRLRRRSRGALGEGALPVEDEESAAGLCAGGIERVEALHDLERLTQGESSQVLHCVRLYFLEGCTFAEVGLALDVSRQTASRVLKQLSKRIQKQCGEGN
jgi:RNA polymerase sigma factor (sigma-70 family)